MIKQVFKTITRIIRRARNERWKNLEQALGIRIYNFDLFERALRHPSIERAKSGDALQCYERLEFLGDAILGSVVAEYLYRKFPDKMEGFLTTMRSKIVSGVACAHTARSLKLGQFVEIDAAMEARGGRNNSSVLANCLESVIGAIHLDSGSKNSFKFIYDHILERVDFPSLIAQDNNYKSQLQEYVQARGWPTPEYHLVDTNGPPHHTLFTVDVLISGQREGRGEATNKKTAEQHAAHHALNSLVSKNTH
ncbi:MAG: ribonuclease III [Bacteroidetes bacterium]|nr:ribonuclease III [Bacteroidota bacterium]MCY4233251.1 ribonuclease III [Bacteroidota bacterium]